MIWNRKRIKNGTRARGAEAWPQAPVALLEGYGLQIGRGVSGWSGVCETESKWRHDRERALADNQIETLASSVMVRGGDVTIFGLDPCSEIQRDHTVLPVDPDAPMTLVRYSSWRSRSSGRTATNRGARVNLYLVSVS